MHQIYTPTTMTVKVMTVHPSMIIRETLRPKESVVEVGVSSTMESATTN